MHSVDFLIIGIALFAAAGTAGFTLRQERRQPSFLRLALTAITAYSAGVAVMVAASLWLAGTGDPWNAARLTPAISLHHGYTLYYPMGEGPILSTVVGPMAFLFYWAVGLIKDTSPTTLILAASALNLCAFSLLVHQAVRAIVPSLAHRCIAVLVAAHFVFLYPSLRYSIFCIHADAPALFFGALGCGLYIFTDNPCSWKRALLIGFCMSAAVWAKQSVAPLGLALFLIAFIRDGFSASLRLLAACLLVFGAFSLVIIRCFGWAELRDNMLIVPAHHPWLQMSLSTGEIYQQVSATGIPAMTKVAIAEILNLVRSNWLLFSLLTAAFLSRFVDWKISNSLNLLRARWTCLFILALSMLPTAALGRTKLGGEINHESFVVFFLAAAVLIWVLETPAIQSTKIVYLGTLLGVLTLVNSPQLLAYPGWWDAWQNQNEVAFRYQRIHPDKVYFPWNPLTSLLTNRKLYHFDYGVFDRNIGNARVQPEHLRQAMPSQRPVIASYLAHHDYILRTYFPDYVQLPSRPQLPGWRLFGPPDSTNVPNRLEQGIHPSASK